MEKAQTMRMKSDCIKLLYIQYAHLGMHTF